MEPLEWIAAASTLLKLIGLAQDAGTQVKATGAVKKSAVVSFFMALFGGAEQVLTGGAANTVKELEPAVGAFIDTAVQIANTVATVSGNAPVVVDDTAATAMQANMSGAAGG